MTPVRAAATGPTAILAATTLMAGLLIVAAPVAEAGGRFRLAGVTTIEATRTSSVEVSVSSNATLSTTVSLTRAEGPNPDVSVRGKGPFVGVVLVPDPLPEDPAEAALIAGRFSTCSGPACPHGRKPLNYIFSGPGAKRTHELATGNYRLYVIADEGPAAVTLRLQGLPGRARIAARTEAPGLAYAPEVRKDINTGGAYYGAGKFFEGGGAGIVAQALFFSSENFQGADYGSCLYDGPAPPPEQIAFGVQCATFAAALGESRLTSTSGDGEETSVVVTSMMAWDSTSPPSVTGERGAGVWYRSAGAIQRPGSQAFYLSFDDAPLPSRAKNTTYKGGKRITTWHYEGPALGASGTGVCTHPIHACALFPTNRNESKIEVTIEDASGLPVLASVSQRDANGGLQTIGTICGTTEMPLLIQPGFEIVIFPWAVGRSSCPGIATTGEVIVTFAK